MKSLRATGYTAMFLPPALLVTGHAVQFDLLLPLCFFVVFPLLRLAIGSVSPGGTRDWTTAERTLLDGFPRIYAAVFAATMLWVLWVVGSRQHQSVQESIEFSLAVLVLGGLAACVAHDLGHRRSAWDRRCGHLISALAGYPFFIFEHWAHHANARDTSAGHCPRADESVWSYAARRAWMAPRAAFASNTRRDLTNGRVLILDDLWLYFALSATVWGAFTVVGGTYGFCLYFTLVLGVPFLLNTITYIQHWGLGDDGPRQLDGIRQIGWDDRSRFQSWLILGISFHHQHHEEAELPYYMYGPTVGAPQLPAEYALLVPVCFVPPLWRRLMKPVLRSWCDRERPTVAG